MDNEINNYFFFKKKKNSKNFNMAIIDYNYYNK